VGFAKGGEEKRGRDGRIEARRRSEWTRFNGVPVGPAGVRTMTAYAANRDLDGCAP
jgi:hypothetical protein